MPSPFFVRLHEVGRWRRAQVDRVLDPGVRPGCWSPAARGCGVLIAGAAWSWVVVWLTYLPASIWSGWRWVSMRDCFSLLPLAHDVRRVRGAAEQPAGESE